jgi:hypothetical protein
VRCFGGTTEEINFAHWWFAREKVLTEIERLLRERDAKEVHAVREELERENREMARKTIARLDMGRLRSSLKDLGFDDALRITPGTQLGFNFILREVSKSFASAHGIPMTTIYDSATVRNREFKEGERDAVIALLSDVPIIYEFQLAWEQVLEFRRDKEARQRYRRFLHWLDEDMVGKSQGFIADEIAVKLEHYEGALKKHGIKTVLGAVEEALDGKYLIGASGVTGSLTLAGHPTMGILAGAGLIVGKMTVQLAQTKLDFEDIERGPNSEVSWVYEVKKLTKQ